MPMHELKQSTAVSIIVGPLLSDDDGKTPVTALTVGNITANIIKGVTATSLTLTASGGSNDFTHIASGYWALELTATDTNTLGSASVVLQDDDVFVSCRETIDVVTANWWDSKHSTDKLDCSLVQVLGTAVTESTTTPGVLDVNVAEISDNVAAADNLQTAAAASTLTCDVTKISGNTTAADNCQKMYDGTGYIGGVARLGVNVLEISSIEEAATALNAQLESTYITDVEDWTVSDTSFAPTTTQFEVTSGGGASSTNDQYVGNFIRWHTGALKGATYEVTDYVGATKRFTVSTMVAAPADGDLFVLV